MSDYEVIFGLDCVGGDQAPIDCAVVKTIDGKPGIMLDGEVFTKESLTPPINKLPLVVGGDEVELSAEDLAGVTSIRDYALYDYHNLTSITIPDSVTSIGNYAFYNCTGLTSVTIGNGVTSVGASAFRGCSSLTSVIIPDSVTSIGKDALSGCSKLESITIPFIGAEKDGEANTHFGFIFGAKTYNDNADTVPTTLKTVTVTSGTAIGTGAFFGCSSLTSVTVPATVANIEDSAFSGCSGLTSFVIPDAVTCIKKSVFSGCSKLTSIAIPVSVTSIGDSAFSGCSGLTSITVPDSVTSIGNYAFYNCTGLTSVTIGNGVTSIGSWAFENDSNITTFRILATTPPTASYIFGGNSSQGYVMPPCLIYVPEESVEDYKDAWSSYAAYIEADPN